MKSDVSFKRILQFPTLMWVLLFGAFITRGSYYMVWPFLALILYQEFGISATEVGVILSSAALVSVIVGFVGGTLSDRFGRKQLMFASGMLYVVSFTLLAQSQTIVEYIVVITLCSMAKALWEPPTSALIADIVPELQTRELAMQMRYFIVNVGSAIGPMAGVWFGLTGQKSSFYITAFAFALFLVLLRWGFNAHGKVAQHAPSSQHRFSDSLQILLRDKVLQCVILANALCMFIYGQMDTTLVQYLTRAEVPDLLLLISSMIVANATVIVCSQFVLLKMMAGLTLEARIQIGLWLLAVAQLWFAFNPLTLFWGWIGAVIVMSLAEAILFPTMNVHIDRLAPKDMRGAYFGAASFYTLGFALAPVGGGILLDSIGGQWLYLTAFMMCFAVIYMYRLSPKLSRPKTN